MLMVGANHYTMLLLLTIDGEQKYDGCTCKIKRRRKLGPGCAGQRLYEHECNTSNTCPCSEHTMLLCTAIVADNGRAAAGSKHCMACHKPHALELIPCNMYMYAQAGQLG